MSELLGFVNKVAASEATTILVQGESGTGKDLIAKAIHYQSRAAGKALCCHQLLSDSRDTDGSGTLRS